MVQRKSNAMGDSVDPSTGEIISASEGAEDYNPHGIPGSEDLLVQYGHGQQSLPVFMLTGSTKPEEYLLRARFPENRLDEMLEILADHNTIHLGDPDMMNLFAFKANGSAGVNGQARLEAVRIATHAMIAPLARGIGQVAGRMRRNYNNSNG